MHRLFLKADKLSGEVIGAAIEVHRIMGSGLIESIYEKCLGRELALRHMPATQQQRVSIDYKGLIFDETLRYDTLVDECLLLELKVVEKILPIHKAQLLSYMKLLDIPIGLLINFREERLIDGIHRLLLKGADR